MTTAATASPSSLPAPAAKPTWGEAILLAVAVVGFLWVSDAQGMLWHRDQWYWLQSGVAYLAAAGLALWKWDWVERVFLSRRFAVVALAVVAVIWAASAPRGSGPVQAGIPVLRAGERDRLPTVSHALPGAVAVEWVVPATSHGDVMQERNAQAPDTFAFDLPAGWSELPSSSMRLVNLRVAGDARAECYLSSLPGQAGGVLENVNRWRDQMGAAPLAADAVAKLPRTKLLGRDAVLVEIDGSFTGMGGTKLEDARMVGAIAALPAATLFLKMTGPRDLVQQERAGFDKVLASLRMTVAAPHAKGKVGDAAAQGQPAAAGDGNLRWTVPDGWRAGGDRPMRLVTMNPAGAPEVECYVTVLPGRAGGTLDNINRWRGQFGQPSVTETEIAALPKLEVLGREVPLVEVSGTFTGMGDEAKPGYALLGSAVALADRTVFVKMTGPQAAVQRERERFLAFCRSLSGE